MTEAAFGQQTVAAEQIEMLVLRSALRGADRVAIGLELERLSSGWSTDHPELGVDAQTAAVSVLTVDPPADYAHAYAAAGATHNLIARLTGADRRQDALALAGDAVTRWVAAASFAQDEADVEAVAIQLTLLQKLVLWLGDVGHAVAAQKSAVSVLARFDPPADQQAAHQACLNDMVVTLQARLRELSLTEEEVERQVRELVERPVVEQEFDTYWRDQVMELVVGAPTAPVTLGPDGAWHQQFRFGSLIKPQGEPLRLDTRWAVSIEIAAIKCFGTDDPSGHDEPYVVTNVFAVDPLVGTNAISTQEKHWEGGVDGGEVFATEGWQVADGFFIPGSGHVSLIVALWDEESARPSHIKDQWHGIVTAGLLAGLAELHPIAGASGAVADAMNHIVENVADSLISVVSGPFADDLLDTVGYRIDADFLARLQADANGLPRQSASIPGIVYNFPETPEAGDGTWLFSGGGGSYRIFYNIRTAPITLTPEPHLP